jgi:folate-dependent phosphoribosylglycinamide formyltransferase PurN
MIMAMLFCKQHATLGKDETPETMAEKIHLLEHEHYPALLERLLQECQIGVKRPVTSWKEYLLL